MSDEPRSRTRYQEAADWWWSLQDRRRDGRPNPNADRPARATLRRAERDEAVTEEAVFDLYRRLDRAATGFDPGRLALAVRLALVLAHVRDDDGAPAGRFAAALGRKSFADKAFETAVLKPLRFQRLLAARDEDDIIREFRRAVDIAGNRANLRDLAFLLLNWEREATRARFAFDYFAAGETAPPEPAEQVA